MICRLCQNTGRYRGSAGTRQECHCLAGKLIVEKRRRNCNIPAHFKYLRIALAVRRNVEAYALKAGENPNLKHACGLASAALALALENAGYCVELVEGRYSRTGFTKPIIEIAGLNVVKATGNPPDSTLHCWVVLNQTIIDITFSQFSETAPRVFVTRKDDKHYHVREVWKSQKDALDDVKFLQPKHLIRRLAKV